MTKTLVSIVVSLSLLSITPAAAQRPKSTHRATVMIPDEVPIQQQRWSSKDRSTWDMVLDKPKDENSSSPQ